MEKTAAQWRKSSSLFVFQMAVLSYRLFTGTSTVLVSFDESTLFDYSVDICRIYHSVGDYYAFMIVIHKTPLVNQNFFFSIQNIIFSD